MGHTGEGTVDAAGALALASRAGEYFAVSVPAGPQGWRPLRELADGGPALAERVASARARLAGRGRGGEVELRASASIDSLGVVSRLLSPALATATLSGVALRLRLDDVLWRDVAPGPLPVALDAPRGEPVPDVERAAAVLVAGVIRPVVAPLLERYRVDFRLSPRTLWGNAASALAGAAGMLRCSGLDLRLPPDDVVAAVLALAPLAGHGRYERAPADLDDRFFVRSNCCLYYRVPGGGTCGDCVLRRRSRTTAELSRPRSRPATARPGPTPRGSGPPDVTAPGR